MELMLVLKIYGVAIAALLLFLAWYIFGEKKK
jgi:hypothetical protein